MADRAGHFCIFMCRQWNHGLRKGQFVAVFVVKVVGSLYNEAHSEPRPAPCQMKLLRDKAEETLTISLCNVPTSFRNCDIAQ
jgi:hypothetical protein